jgi:hypothetical protein
MFVHIQALGRGLIRHGAANLALTCVLASLKWKNLIGGLHGLEVARRLSKRWKQ